MRGNWLIVLGVFLLFSICYYLVMDMSVEIASLREEIVLLDEENRYLMEEIRRLGDKK